LCIKLCKDILQHYEKVQAAAGARRMANGCGGTQTDSFGRYYTCAVKLNYNGLNICHRYGMYSTVSIYHNKTQTSLNNLTWCLVWIVNVNDQAFTDVTLATLDNQHVSAHKIIFGPLLLYCSVLYCSYIVQFEIRFFAILSNISLRAIPYFL